MKSAPDSRSPPALRITGSFALGTKERGLGSTIGADHVFVVRACGVGLRADVPLLLIGNGRLMLLLCFTSH